MPPMARKTSYKIGDACRLLDIQPYVLRYWETEFPVLQPQKSQSGQRTYSERELAVIRRIKQLLYDEGYTIAGAKKKLDGELAATVVGTAEEGSLFAATAAEIEVVSGAGLPPVEEVAAPQQLDSPAHERIEQLRTGLQEALGEARGLQQLLRRGSAGH